MPKMFKLVICLFFILSVAESCFYTYPQSHPIKCVIYSEKKSIVSKISLKKGEKGQEYYEISLINSGREVDKIDSIEITLNVKGKIDTELPIVFGGTCMGRTQIKQSNSLDNQSESGMYLMTKYNENRYGLVGVLTWNIFRPNIYNKDNDIVIKAFGEKKPIKPGESILFEKIIEIKNESWQDILFAYGEEIANEHKIKPKESLQLNGWSTWDYYGRVYNTKDVINNIDQIAADGLKVNIIQIDGGWWTARGDYLSVRKDLQGGMKAIADYAKSKGYRAGIHLDGFRGDKTSNLYKQHPDWFLKDQDGETICQVIDKKDTYMQYIYFDYSNPAVCAYIKDVLRTIRTEWGFSYFKIDFMRYGLLETILVEHGKEKKGIKKVTAVKAFNENLTSMERTRLALKSMREGIGDGFFLACSSVFGPTIGIVDGIRTGGDISPTFEHYTSRCLQNGGNFYLNHVVAQNDADYLVVRNKDDEEPSRAWGEDKFGGNTTFDEAKMWSDYVALYGGIKINSDNLLTLRSERKQLIKNAFALKTATRFLPLDLWSHAKNTNDAFNVMLGENNDGVYLSLFNWEDKDKQMVIGGLQNTELTEALSGVKINTTAGKLIYNLKHHNSIIIKVEGMNFNLLRKSITIN
jgi:alpha-galactosidase